MGKDVQFSSIEGYRLQVEVDEGEFSSRIFPHLPFTCILSCDGAYTSRMRQLTFQIRCVLLLFAGILTSSIHAATTNTLDFGVDPYNLEKGDWIWQMPASQTALGVPNVQGVIDYEVSKGMKWLAVKCGDGGSIWSQFNSDLITRCHNAGLKVFGWQYCYGSNVTGEINVALNALGLGADGLIIDAESQYETDTNPFGHGNAIKFCQALRKQYPNRFIAHAPSPSVHFHPGFPYVDFGMYCDAVMLQAYWGYRAITPAAMVAMMESEYRTNLINKWVGSATNALKPIVPVAQADMPNVTGQEELDFVTLLNNSANPLTPGGYHGVSFWDCQEHTSDQWDAIGVASILPMTTNRPLIQTQPVNRCVDQGSNATFSARAYGAAPLSYQWRFNGVDLAGETGYNLTVANAQATNMGSFSVMVTNLFGAITSRVVQLTVVPPLPPLELAFTDDFETNSAARWNLFQRSGNGTADFTTNWSFNYSTQAFTAALIGYNRTTSNIPVAPNTTGGTRTGLKITVNKDATASASGVSLYPKGMNFGSNCVLRFDAWINYAGGPYGATASGTTEMLTCGLNHLGTQVNWIDINTTTSDGIWFTVDGEGDSGERYVSSYGPGSDFRAYQGNGAAAPTHLSFANSGLAVSGALSEDNIDLFYGNLFSYPNYETPGAPGKRWLQVELSQINKVITWRLNGVVVAQRTNTSSYLSGDVMIGYMDPFSSISNPKEDNYVIIDNVRVYVPARSPIMVAQPTNTIVNVGANASFSVAANGTAPLTYQWRLGDINLPGATGTNLYLTNVQMSQVGNYSVVITNATGSVTSSNAALNVVQMRVSSATLTNGEFELNIAGAPGVYTVLTSTNLVDWLELPVVTNYDGGILFIDRVSETFPQRFYRVSAPK